MRVLFLLIGLVLCGSIASAETKTLAGRSYELTDGRANKAASAPLVIAMHGFLGTPSTMQNKTNFDQLSKTKGFVVAYPRGVKRRWNDGRSPESTVDDVAFLAALITKLIGDGIADPKKIFLAGHSNGGGMAMRMACDAPDLIAGIAVIATKIPANYPCLDGEPVPVVFFFGTEDPVAPHEGRPKNSRLGATLSAEKTVAVWLQKNKCGRASRTVDIDEHDDATTVEITRYTRCKAAVMQVLIDGHGHGWPGAGPRLARIQGPATREVDAASLSWWFFTNL